MVKRGELVDANGNGTADAGETILFTFHVSNTGNVPVAGVAVQDSMLTGFNPVSSDLSVDESVDFTASPYVVLESDLVAGQVVNHATASGSVAGGARVTSPEASVTVRATPARVTVGFAKVAAPSTAVAAGQHVTYTVTATNTGNLTLPHATIRDDLTDVVDDGQLTGAVTASTGAASVVGAVLRWSGSLAPGATVTLTYGVVTGGNGNRRLVNSATLDAALTGVPTVPPVRASAATTNVVRGPAVPPPNTSPTPSPAPSPAPAGQPLPNTGADLAREVGLAASLLLMGTLTLLVVRRRRETD